jgi:hypothetical protein
MMRLRNYIKMKNSENINGIRISIQKERKTIC